MEKLSNTIIQKKSGYFVNTLSYFNVFSYFYSNYESKINDDLVVNNNACNSEVVILKEFLIDIKQFARVNPKKYINYLEKNLPDEFRTLKFKNSKYIINRINKCDQNFNTVAAILSFGINHMKTNIPTNKLIDLFLNNIVTAKTSNISFKNLQDFLINPIRVTTTYVEKNKKEFTNCYPDITINNEQFIKHAINFYLKANHTSNLNLEIDDSIVHFFKNLAISKKQYIEFRAVEDNSIIMQNLLQILEAFFDMNNIHHKKNVELAKNDKIVEDFIENFSQGTTKDISLCLDTLNIKDKKIIFNYFANDNKYPPLKEKIIQYKENEKKTIKKIQNTEDTNTALLTLFSAIDHAHEYDSFSKSYSSEEPYADTFINCIRTNYQFYMGYEIIDSNNPKDFLTSELYSDMQRTIAICKDGSEILGIKSDPELLELTIKKYQNMNPRFFANTIGIINNQKFNCNKHFIDTYRKFLAAINLIDVPINEVIIANQGQNKDIESTILNPIIGKAIKKYFMDNIIKVKDHVDYYL